MQVPEMLFLGEKKLSYVIMTSTFAKPSSAIINVVQKCKVIPVAGRRGP
jgi:hypothetical protein